MKNTFYVTILLVTVSFFGITTKPASAQQNEIDPTQAIIEQFNQIEDFAKEAAEEYMEEYYSEENYGENENDNEDSSVETETDYLED